MDSKDKYEGSSAEQGDDDEAASEEASSEHESSADESPADESPSPARPTPAKLASGTSKLLEFLTAHYRTLDPRWLALFRICFGALLISELGYRWRYARMLFSNDGLLP